MQEMTMTNEADNKALKQELILAIETSCDETSAAVLAGGRTVLSNVISSQVPVHQRFGGVVPEIASRKHIETILPIIEQALQEAGCRKTDLAAVAVTCGPGLVGALLVGLAAGKGLAFALDIPLIGVNHIESHIFANFIANPALEPPFVALVVSGGHTSLVAVTDYNDFELLGQTRDDAAGEAFDKIARVLGLPYPGGPEIEKLAVGGERDAIAFPRSTASHNSFEFSFSGLKSAVLNYVNQCKQKETAWSAADVAASFQAAVVDVLADRAVAAARHCGVTDLVLAGGVASNKELQRVLQDQCAAAGLTLHVPPPVLCTDNAAMIGCRAYYQWQGGFVSPLTLNAYASYPVGSKR